MNVWIAQIKCPENHTVMATAAEIPDEECHLLAKLLQLRFNELVEQYLLNHECGICRSRNLHVEVAKTGFDSMEEARPVLEASQRQQLAVAQYLKQSKN